MRIFYLLVFFLYPCFIFPFTFTFNNTDDTKNYRLFSASLQNVEQNTGIAQASFEQAYEAFLRPQDVDSKNNTFALKGEYHYSQRLFRSQEAFNLIGQDKVYQSFFTRQANGKIKALSKDDFYPSVRSVPVFPQRDLNIKDTWTDLGYEAQDFSLLNYKQPFLVPFIAQYKYINDISLNAQQLKDLIKQYQQYQFGLPKEILHYQNINTGAAKNIAIIEVMYNVDYSSAQNTEQTKAMELQNGNPVEQSKGFYHGIIFWDKLSQEEVLNIGEYNFVYTWKNKDQRHWSGKEYGIITVLKKDKQAIEELAKKAQDINPELEVTKEEKGVKLILGDLLFYFNKTQLRPEVIVTLNKIVTLLKANPSYAIHITGHSDDIGSPQAKEKIAYGRAQTVANFLITEGIESSRVSFSGASDTKPRLPNINSYNRKKNRRVELDIITQ